MTSQKKQEGCEKCHAGCYREGNGFLLCNCPCHTAPVGEGETQKGLKERFEARFGRRPDNPDDYQSVGETAGCDDCEINKAERDDHWKFLVEELAAQETAFKERVVPHEIEWHEQDSETLKAKCVGWNACRQEVLTRIERLSQGVDSEEGMN